MYKPALRFIVVVVVVAAAAAVQSDAARSSASFPEASSPRQINKQIGGTESIRFESGENGFDSAHHGVCEWS
jgi:hypothetical protein